MVHNSSNDMVLWLDVTTTWGTILSCSAVGQLRTPGLEGVKERGKWVIIFNLKNNN